jgi:quercetin dioxygenase-like cupin family protein
MSKIRKNTAANELPQDVTETLSAAMRPMELSAAQRDRMRMRVINAARDASPLGTTTIRSANATWIEIAPFVDIRQLQRDDVTGTHTSLMRMRPGGFIPAHRHSKDEDFIILEGECHIGTHLLRAGDVHTARAGSLHERITTQHGVLVLLKGEYPYPAQHA